MNIAVTGLNATDNPGPGVPIIRSIRDSEKFEGNIIGLIYDALEPGIYMENIADKKYLIPYPSSGLENYLNRLIYIHEKEKLDIIIPSLDSELYVYIKLRNKLAELGIKIYIPTLEQLNIRSKDKLFDFCQNHSIKVPKNILAMSHKDLYSIPDTLSYPVVIKGIFYEAYISNNFEEAQTAFNKLTAKWGYPIIIQEFIKGDEFNVAALGDGTGRTVGAVAMRKTYITDKGKGWAGITIDNRQLIELAKNVIEKTKWKSGLELEFIKDNKTNEYYLLEINPRFPAWIYLATSAGQNMPYSLIELATSKDVATYENYEIGKIFVRSAWDLITDVKIFEKIAVSGEL